MLKRTSIALLIALVASGCRIDTSAELPPIEICWNPQVKTQAQALAQSMFVTAVLRRVNEQATMRNQKAVTRADVEPKVTVKVDDYFTQERIATSSSATCGAEIDVSIAGADGKTKTSTGNIVNFSVYQGERGPSVTMSNAEIAKQVLSLDDSTE